MAQLSLATAAKSLQSCPTLCDPINGSPPGSQIPGSLQARVLELVAIVFSNAGKWKVKVKLFSRVRLLVTPWTAAYQAPPSMGFSRQEYWSGLPLPSPMQESESEVIQSCPTLSDPMDCSLPGSSIHGILQARVLEWGAIAFSVLSLGSNRFPDFLAVWLSILIFLDFLMSSPFLLKLAWPSFCLK